MAGDWAKRLAAAGGPVLAALSLAAAAGGPLPELATLAVLVAFCVGLVWLAWSSPRLEDLWAVTGPAIAFASCAAGLVFTWPWPMPPAAAAALWLGPFVSLAACAAWALPPSRGWPPGAPGWLERVPLRAAVACFGAGAAAIAGALGGPGATWPVAFLAAAWSAAGAVVTVYPLSADVAAGRASELKLARLRQLLEQREEIEWRAFADPDLEAKAAGLQRDLATAHDRIAEQTRVIAELKEAGAEQAARIDRLASGYRRVREAAQDNLGLLSRVRGDVEGALNDVGIISDSVGQIVGTSESTDNLIDESRQRLREALESMEYVRLSIEDSLDLVEAFAKRSRQIEDVLKDISDIAYFTRILSLNATIEAARAGEQGKGFRFLADEVQKLAQTITQSTSDITALLKLVQQESKQTVESVLRSANQVGEAADTVSLLDDALRRIMDELHSMDADLQDAHLMSLRVAETREGAIAALSTLEEGNRRADFAASVVSDVAVEDRAVPASTQVPVPGHHAAQEPQARAVPPESSIRPASRETSLPRRSRSESDPPGWAELPEEWASIVSPGQAASRPDSGEAAPKPPPLQTGPLSGRGPTAPLPDMEWPEELD